MQEQRNANGPLPGSTFFQSLATDSSMDPQSYWNGMLNPSHVQPSECVVESSNSACQERPASSVWNLGESSSTGGCCLTNQNNLTNDCNRAALMLGERQSDNRSLNSLNANQHTEQDVTGRFFVQSSSVPSDLITNLEFAGSNQDENNDDDCQVVECVNSLRFGSSNEKSPVTHSYSHHFAGMPSETNLYPVEGADRRPNSSSGGRRLSSCKRKLREASFGQSSGGGSSNHIHNVGSSLLQGTAICHNAASSTPVAPGNNIGIKSEGSQTRLRLSIGEAASEFPLSLGTSRNAERSRRVRLRINTSHQQDGIPVTSSCTQSAGGSPNVLSTQHSVTLPPVSNSFDLGLTIVPEDGSLQRQTVSSLRRNSQSQWSRASSSRAGSPNSAISGEGVSFQCEEPYLKNGPGIISQHPMFVPATEIGSSSQNSGNWCLAAKNVGVSLGVASSSDGSLRSGFHSPAPSLVPHHHFLNPSRLPAYAPQSLINPPIMTGNHNSSQSLIYSGPFSSLPEIPFPSTSSNHSQQRFHARSALLLETYLGSTVGTPHPSLGLVAASDGRSRLVLEIRNILDRMRRGETLRVEDLMILDQSGFFGMTDFHDRHRDMRLDVDNMSYEELLALEERIGNVCTGLSEETISSRLKQRKYVHISTHKQVEEEPCCICQDQYSDGQGLGILECGHEFHSGCITQWLMHKNICPICKTTGLNK